MEALEIGSINPWTIKLIASSWSIPRLMRFPSSADATELAGQPGRR